MMDIPDVGVFSSKKIVSMDETRKIVLDAKTRGQSVGLCHGGFDLLHPGHVKHFESARKECDVLLVSVTADRFVSERKGSGRPIFPDRVRAYMIASLSCVDYVLVSETKRGVDVIDALCPDYYFKGSDYAEKKTPGITAEREAIARCGGAIKYTRDPRLSTTGIIGYIKKRVDEKAVLLCVDRDGTLILNDDFFGKEDYWQENLRMNEPVVSVVSYIQTKYPVTTIVISNQAGVARRMFSCGRVDEINRAVDDELKRRGVLIDAWRYCPDVDALYAKKMESIDFDQAHVLETTERKPHPGMVISALLSLEKSMSDFERIIVLGDREEDAFLAKNISASFVDVRGKTYEEMIALLFPV